MISVKTLITVPILLLLFVIPASTDDTGGDRADSIRSNYAKYEYRIAMRDGTRLFTAVYVPVDSSRTYPFLMVRTPYGVAPYGSGSYKEKLGPSAEYEQDGYIFVFQDVRGRSMSEGDFINMRPHLDEKSSATAFDESTDTWDTIEWLLENIERHNGKVGQWGVSYPGFYAAAGMIDSHPALKAVAPMAPIADWFWDDMHHHGAFTLNLAFNFFYSFGRDRPEPTTEKAERIDPERADGYDFFLDLGPLSYAQSDWMKGEIDFWNQLVEHPNYDDFWQSRNLLPHLKGISAAVLVVGGLFDTEDLYGPLHIYAAVEEANPEIDNRLVMGPWSHGAWIRSDGRSLGDVDFGLATADDYRRRIELPFFRHYLRDEPQLDLPEATIFETGVNRWRTFDRWPPSSIVETAIHLMAGGRLSFAAPTAESESYEEFVSDPAKPVPYTTEITTRWAKNYMTEDQRFAARRPDVLVYRTEVLSEDLTVAGPIEVDMWVSTSGTAADWIVKVIDVQPETNPDGTANPAGGRQTLVRAEALRGRFRNSYERPEPFVPNQPTRLRFPLQDVMHTFQRGHRLMVQVQSTWFPFIDRNPQTWVENIFEAQEDDFLSATHRVHHSADHPSRLLLGVLE